uniref:TOG domain-containing protein n=1 Tax=Zea mays TaxID=4577 RepID=A0A804QY00_MAIZE
MALRALDNTKPAAVEERPKKVAKVGVPAAAAKAAASPGSGGKKKKGNDENSAPRATAAAAEQAVEYISSEELVADLDSKDWVRTCEALNDARRLAIHHPALLNPILEKVVLAVVKTMKSPRSAVLKTSIMACADIFSSFGNLLASVSDDAFDKLLLQLLLKASQDKRFVCEEAEKATRAMAASMPPLPLLKKLKAYVHHANLRVRAKAAVAISHCAARMDIGAMKEFGMSALLQLAVELLNDRLPEAREAARGVVASTHAAFVKEAAASGQEDDAAASWESLCALSLPPISAQAVAKIAAAAAASSQ